MGIPEIKNYLHKTIALTEDERLLSLIWSVIYSNESGSEKSSALNQADREAIERGVAELREGRKIPHKDVLSKYSSR